MAKGNAFWARDGHDVILYEDGEEEERVDIGEEVLCLSLSPTDGSIYIGTENGHVFTLDTASCVVTKNPFELEGEKVWQVEESGNKLVVKSSPSNRMDESLLTAVSALDWTKERALPEKTWLSYFEIANDDTVAIIGKDRELLRVPIQM